VHGLLNVPQLLNYLVCDLWFVYCVQDTANGFLMNVNDQITEACHKISNDPKLRKGYNAVGFSQGGQFL